MNINFRNSKRRGCFGVFKVFLKLWSNESIRPSNPPQCLEKIDIFSVSSFVFGVINFLICKTLALIMQEKESS